MKTRRWVVLLSLLLSLAFIIGCAGAKHDVSNTSSEAIELPAATSAAAQSYDRAAVTEGSKGGAVPAAAPEADTYAGAELTQQMIIRTVNITMLVDDVEKSAQETMALITSFQGYVSGSNLWHEGERTYANITLRVPAESLDALLAALRNKAVRIDNESISTQDVSQEYVDLESRLRNLEATEQELLKVLENITEKSYKAEDVLAVYRELTQVRSEIEQIKGRQQYLENLTALATVQVNLQPVATPPTVVEEGKFNPMVAINTALRSLVRILEGTYEVIVVIILNVVPVLVILAVPVVVIVLLVRGAKRRKARKQIPPQA
ncbi:MAG: DUF4349 domain-containing protein [Chloroflexi bacterium]|nr:DUF4349 domain-containing protein [Chloroflexota bacterium]